MIDTFGNFLRIIIDKITSKDFTPDSHINMWSDLSGNIWCKLKERRRKGSQREGAREKQELY